jgi:cyclase
MTSADHPTRTSLGLFRGTTSMVAVRRRPALIAIVLCAQVAVAQAQPVFDIHALAPGVFAAEVVRNPPAYAFANSLVVVGDSGVLVVDTQQSVTAARSLIAEIARLTSAPVRWVVNTHWHADHVYGNQAYAEAFPDVQFIAHATLAGDLHTLGEAWRAQELSQLPVSIAARRGWLESGVGPDGTALTGANRAAVTRSLALRESYFEELRRITPSPPTRTFADQLEIQVGAHRVLLLHVGPAHTRGDIVVALPELRLVAAGDVIEAGMPYFADAAPSGWLAALGRIAEMKPAMLLPSHGPLQRDSQLLDDTRALLEAVMNGASAASNAPPVEGSEGAAALKDLEERWTSRYGTSAAAFREGVETAIRRAREELDARRPASRDRPPRRNGKAEHPEATS